MLGRCWDVLVLAAEVRDFVAVFGLAVVFFAVDADLVAVLGLVAAFALDVDALLPAVVFLAAVVFFAAGFFAAVVFLVPVVALGAAGGLMAEMVLAAFVSASAAVASALVALSIVFMAVFIAWAEVVALEAAACILVAADDTFVAADVTLVAAAVGLTDAVVDFDVDFDALLRAVVAVGFLAVARLAPALVRLALAVERRAVVVVFVGTDPSPRVDQLRVDLFHIWRRSTRRPDARRSLFPGTWSSESYPEVLSSHFPGRFGPAGARV